MILHVIDDLYPEQGGPPAVVMEFVRAQARMGERVAVLVTHAPRKPEQRAALAERWHGLGVEYLVLEELPRGDRPAAARAHVDRLKPDVIHVHCIWEALLRQVAAHARRRGIPYVLSTHGMLHPYALARKRLKKWAYLLVFRSLVQAAGEVFVLNREEAESVVGRFHRSSVVLANGIVVADYEAPPSGSIRRRLPGLGDRPFVLFMGRLHPIKGIDKLIRSYAHARRRGLDMDLVIAGPDDGERSALEALATELGLGGCIHFPGGVFGPEKRDLFATCAMFAHRPRFEGFGITVVEALASGRPVVTTVECKLDGAAEAGALQIAPDDDVGFGNALVELAGSEDGGRALGLRGRAWVTENLAWDSLVRKAEASYARLSGKGRIAASDGDPPQDGKSNPSRRG